jgi:hypothetical protein
VWRGGFRLGISVSGPFGCRCLTSFAMLRFHTPLIELDGRISRIQLSDKVGWIPLFHTFAHEPLPLLSLKLVQSQLLVQVFVREPFLSLTRLLEFRAQPLTHPIASVAVDAPVGFAHRSDAEIARPTA